MLWAGAISSAAAFGLGLGWMARSLYRPIRASDFVARGLDDEPVSDNVIPFARVASASGLSLGGAVVETTPAAEGSHSGGQA